MFGSHSFVLTNTPKSVVCALYRAEQSKVNVCCLRSLRSCRLRSSNRFRLRRDAHVLNSFATAKISLYGIPLPQHFGKLVCFISLSTSVRVYTHCLIVFQCSMRSTKSVLGTLLSSAQLSPTQLIHLYSHHQCAIHVPHTPT